MPFAIIMVNIMYDVFWHIFSSFFLKFTMVDAFFDIVFLEITCSPRLEKTMTSNPTWNFSPIPRISCFSGSVYAYIILHLHRKMGGQIWPLWHWLCRIILKWKEGWNLSKHWVFWQICSSKHLWRGNARKGCLRRQALWSALFTVLLTQGRCGPHMTSGSEIWNFSASKLIRNPAKIWKAPLHTVLWKASKHPKSWGVPSVVP